LIDEPKAKELVIRAVSDHLRLHALVRAVKRQLSEGETLARISQILTEHVRFEEQQLFPLVEELVSEDDLKDLSTSGRRDV
jgi:hemerythrin superfamily protein